jgi:hypothetical protein
MWLTYRLGLPHGGSIAPLLGAYISDASIVTFGGRATSHAYINETHIFSSNAGSIGPILTVTSEM